MTATQDEGRRARNKRLKSEAILHAAEELFRLKGYNAVTTQEIAQRADVSNGTFFRHARSKADLLVTVMNSRLRLGHERGLHMAGQGAGAVESVVALLTPLAETGMAHPEVVVAYQRELLFTVDPRRDADLATVEQLESAIREILAITHPEHPEETRAFAAYSIYATMYMDLVRVGVGRTPTDDLPRQLRVTIRTLLRGLLPDDPLRT
ncbi:TetR/AcrR family transcriptional regulator [Austwickia chelonae]|uniref:TetR/AcrR family transcriptional regulator n=1 Tax=Austwickia chelonae TaxID=100225 RepID=UPI000E2377FA|nr:TetR/AcrR family transcriptional regulator [Austwickia chelonae]